MNTFKIIASAASLAVLLVTTAAFIDFGYDTEIKKIQSPTSEGFAVVELFTSEGCSSCPPADELMGRIQAENKNKELYMLAFHVDYWDHQGWKDRFSDHDFSLRQRQYADWMNLQTVYTPQVIVNGSVQMIGSEAGSVLKAINQQLAEERSSSLHLNCAIEDDKAVVHYEGVADQQNAELVLALVQESTASKVKAGENAGRNLSHVQVVRKLTRKSLSGKKEVILYLPDDFNQQGWELIGFVQNLQNGHISQAARFDFDAK